MRPPCSWIVPTLLALTLIGCASSAELARRSRRSLAAGDPRQAYEMARRALDKDAENAEARAAYGAAATEIAIQYRTRIARIAPADTVAAAREALEFRAFRTEVDRYPVAIARDPEDLEVEARLATAAARILYRGAERSLDEGRPKEAYHRFRDSERFDPGYRDVARRVVDAHEQALTRVAILPFEDQANVAGLATALAGRIAAETGRRTGSPALFFTRIVDPEQVLEHVTVGQLRRMTRDDALRIGRRLRAERVVYGRYTALRVDNTTHDFTVPIYRRTVQHVTDGPDRVLWRESSVSVLARERRVALTMAFEVLDTRTGEVVAQHDEPREAFARVVWSDYRADGECKEYALGHEELEREAPDRVRDGRDRWKRVMGSWSLPDFLERARSERVRSGWSSERRRDFYTDTRQRPVFLAELPGVDDLVHIALREPEEPVIAVLRALDPED